MSQPTFSQVCVTCNEIATNLLGMSCVLEKDFLGVSNWEWESGISLRKVHFWNSEVRLFAHP